MTASAGDLLSFVTPDETFSDFLQRVVTEAIPTGLPVVDSHISFRAGQVLEIVGPSGAAKSGLLIQIAVNFLLASSGGHDKAGDEHAHLGPDHVVLIDLDGKYDALRFLQVLDSRLSSAAAASASAAQPDHHQLLSRFHLTRCHSTTEFLAALASLPRRLAQLPGRCRLLLIDGIDAFLWQDRASKPVAAAPAASPAAPLEPPLTLQRAHSAAAELLRALGRQLRLPVVATKRAAVSHVDGAEGHRLQQREPLPQPWQAMVTHRLLVTLAPQAAPHDVPTSTGLLAQWQGAYCGPLTRLHVTDLGVVTTL